MILVTTYKAFLGKRKAATKHTCESAQLGKVWNLVNGSVF